MGILGGLNMYLMGGLLLVIIAMGGYGWWQETKISTLVQENQVLSVEKDALLASLVAVEKRSAIQAAQVQRFEEKADQIEAERVSEQERVDEVRQLFEGGRLDRLLQAKPGLIERRMIDATEVTLQELEDATAIDPALQ